MSTSASSIETDMEVADEQHIDTSPILTPHNTPTCSGMQLGSNVQERSGTGMQEGRSTGIQEGSRTSMQEASVTDTQQGTSYVHISSEERKKYVRKERVNIRGVDNLSLAINSLDDHVQAGLQEIRECVKNLGTENQELQEELTSLEEEMRNVKSERSQYHSAVTQLQEELKNTREQLRYEQQRNEGLVQRYKEMDELNDQHLERLGRTTRARRLAATTLSKWRKRVRENKKADLIADSVAAKVLMEENQLLKEELLICQEAAKQAFLRSANVLNSEAVTMFQDAATRRLGLDDNSDSSSESNQQEERRGEEEKREEERRREDKERRKTEENQDTTKGPSIYRSHQYRFSHTYPAMELGREGASERQRDALYSEGNRETLEGMRGRQRYSESNMARERDLGSNIARERYSEINTARELGGNMGRERDFGSNMPRERDFGSNMQRDGDLRTNTARERDLGGNMGRDRDMEGNMGRETYSEGNIGRERYPEGNRPRETLYSESNRRVGESWGRDAMYSERLREPNLVYSSGVPKRPISEFAPESLRRKTHEYLEQLKVGRSSEPEIKTQRTSQKPCTCKGTPKSLMPFRCPYCTPVQASNFGHARNSVMGNKDRVDNKNAAKTTKNYGKKTIYKPSAATVVIEKHIPHNLH